MSIIDQPVAPQPEFTASSSSRSTRVAVVDRDSGFATVLRKRCDSLGWEQRDLTSVPSVDALVAMRLHAVVIDPSLFGPQWAETIEYRRGNLPELAIVTGEIVIRADQFQAFRDGKSIDLTRREFELLQLLAENAGAVLEREEIYQRVWGFQMAHGDRSVDVFVRKLRQKIEKLSPGWEYIHTHFGVGYRFAPEPPVAEPTRSGKGKGAGKKSTKSAA